MEVTTMPAPSKETSSTPEGKTAAKEHVPLILDPCDKAHDAEHDRYQDEDGACDDGVN
jgi:hypothetical protein